jgi:subtilisin-like proprotein convertase family protein
MPRRPRWTTPLALAAAALGLAVSAHAQVVISQHNGNGGLGTFPFDQYDRDFIELFNKGTTPVSLNGWSVQIFNDSGSTTTPESPVSWEPVNLSGTIYPGEYFLVVPNKQRGSLGASVLTTPLPPADVFGPYYDGALMVGNNAIALMNTNAPLADGVCPVGLPNLVDFVRNGNPNALCTQGTIGASNGTTTYGTVLRKDMGCLDTDSTANDADLAVPPTPRNSSTNSFVAATLNVPNGTGGTNVQITVQRGLAPCNPIAGALTSVTANLSAFGFGSNVALTPLGGGQFSLNFTVPAAQATGRYDIPLTSTDGTTTLNTRAVFRVFPPAPSNDSCSTPVDLSSAGINILSGSVYSEIVNAALATSDGLDAGSCNAHTDAQYSVWYSITTGATPGALMISESGSEDVVYSLHSGCGVASSVCANREEAGLTLLPNTTYLIQVSRETGNSNPPTDTYQLSFKWIPAPGNDEPCAATLITSFPFAATPYAPSATDESASGVNISCDATANPFARNGVWYSFTPTTNGTIKFFERSSNPTNFSIHTGACSSPTQFGCIDESLSGAIIPGLVAGTQYFLLVAYDSAASSQSPQVGYDFTAEFLPAPSNDECVGARDLNAVTLPYTEIVQAQAAGPDTGAGTGGSSSVFNSCSATITSRPNGVWYKYTAASSGTLRISEATGSSSGPNDLFYSVFSACGSSSPIQCSGTGSADDIYVAVTPGSTYYILAAIGTSGTGVNGDYVISAAFYPTPVNDNACNATLITASTTEVVNGPGASADIDVSCNYNIPVQTTTGYAVWYKFQPATSKALRVQNTGGDVLVYGLFQGADCSNLAEVNCRQGSNNALTTDNTAYYNLVGGQTYYLLTGKIANSQPFGLYNLSFQLNDPKGACCAGTTCTIATQATCTGSFRGAFTTCGETPNFEDTTPGAIPDASSTAGATPGVITRTINATGPGSVNDLKLLVDLTHPRLGQMIITLTAPNGATLDLIRRIDDDNDATCPNFGSQGRLTPLNGVYIFDDQAYTPEGPAFDAAGKYFDSSNLFIPSGHYGTARCDLTYPSINAAFAGSPIAGTWTLSVSDNQSSSTGTLNRWGLIINGGATPPCTATCQADFDQNGTRTIDDIFIFINAWFANDPRTDVNGDGRNIDDIFIFLNIWFQGCP